MSRFILDDRLDAPEVYLPIQRWVKALFLRDLRPGERVPDQRVPEILQTLKQPTFITIDQGFWERTLCHPGYCLLYFGLRDDQQEQLPDLLRSLLRRPEFRTRASRMGKVARITPTFIAWWQFRVTKLHRIETTPRPRKR